MKHNLKNRPRWKLSRETHLEQKSREWFEGFEKELRERIEQINRTTKDRCYHPIDIKEILGE